jgi:hypothetical protein
VGIVILIAHATTVKRNARKGEERKKGARKNE